MQKYIFFSNYQQKKEKRCKKHKQPQINLIFALEKTDCHELQQNTSSASFTGRSVGA